MNDYLASFAPALANHLWQSTAFAAAAWLVTILQRKNSARARYGIWLAASVKFLIPFSLFVVLGGLLPKPAQVVAPAFYSAIATAEQPFANVSLVSSASAVHEATPAQRVAADAPSALLVIWLVGAAALLIVWRVRWRRTAVCLREAVPAAGGRELDILRGLEARVNCRRHLPLRLRLSREQMEPSVHGILRPVLVWPERLSERLSDSHMEAILAHELAHARRFDNGTAALHMLVEAVFWFHPLVWWMERRMVEERERACDEAVVALGGSPYAYAEAILETCRFCLAAPLPCVAGVTGADLRDRVVAIMTNRALIRMTWKKRLLLGAFAICAVTVPILLGQVQDKPSEYVPTMTFDVASIHQANPDSAQHWFAVSGKFEPLNSSNLTLENNNFTNLIALAYPGTDHKVDGFQSLAPELRRALFYVQAKGDAATNEQLAKLPRDEVQLEQAHMIQMLLAERFNLKVHWETRDSSTYDLVVTKPRRMQTTGVPPGEDVVKAWGDRGVPPIYQSGSSQTSFEFIAHAATVADIISTLELQLAAPVTDKTGLKDKYYFDLHYHGVATRQQISENEQDNPWPPLETAIQDQLGLKLVPSHGPVRFLVIDHAEMPSKD
jgi:bla regulator protein BlaR1